MIWRLLVEGIRISKRRKCQDVVNRSITLV